MSKTERNFWLDVILFVALLITTVTGLFLWLVIPHTVGLEYLGLARKVWVAIHVSSGFVILAGTVMHIVWHWQWLRALRGRPLREMPEKVRANRVVDRLIWIVFITTIVFGVIAWLLHFGDDTDVVSVADRLHVVTAVMWLVILIVHLALHWKWIVSATQRYVQISAGDRLQQSEYPLDASGASSKCPFSGLTRGIFEIGKQTTAEQAGQE